MPTTRSRSRQATADPVGDAAAVSSYPEAKVNPHERHPKRVKREAAAAASHTAPKAKAAAATGARPLFAFLRGVNVGGRTHSMKSIAGALTAAGFTNVSTFLASGNVMFTPDDDDNASPADAEARVERVLTSLFGAQIPVIVRSMEDLERITGAITKSASATNVVLLKHALTSEQRETLETLSTTAEDLQALDREFVWYSSTKMSESPLFKLSFEKRLGVSAATVRTANTLRRLLQRAANVR